jgi:hypothetical protein
MYMQHEKAAIHSERSNDDETPASGLRNNSVPAIFILLRSKQRRCHHPEPNFLQHGNGWAGSGANRL